LPPALRHHEGHVARQRREGFDDLAEGFLQHEAEALRIDRIQGRGGFHHLDGEGVLAGPPAQGGHAIGGAHRLAIMPQQTFAQREVVGQPVG
jgi:hypothetical protein